MPQSPSAPDAPVIVRIRLRNRQSVARSLTLEPWGDVHEIAPDQAVDLIATGPVGRGLDLELSDEGLIVYGWSGSIVEVQLDPGAPAEGPP